jgi:hypothetical protein
MAEGRRSLQEAGRQGYELRDISIRGVLWAAVAIVVGVVLGMAALAAVVRLLDVSSKEPELSPLERTEVLPPGPRLEVHPARTLAVVRGREQELLEGFAWIDRTAGIARIPIESAMGVLAERGWPEEGEGVRSEGSQP